MKRSIIVKALLCLTGLVISSCGGSSPGSSVAEFKTVEVTMAATPSPFVSKVLPGNACSNGVLSGGQITTDDTPATVTFTSTVYPTPSQGSGNTTTTTTITPQSVSLNGYTVTFTPASSAYPPIADVISGFVGTTVTAGGTATATIPLSTLNIRSSLAANPTLHSCTAASFTYYATITVAGTEQSGTNAAITTTVPVEFSNLP